jgi:hypothetical protein
MNGKNENSILSVSRNSKKKFWGKYRKASDIKNYNLAMNNLQQSFSFLMV